MSTVIPVLYHGTTPEGAQALLSDGWTPGSGFVGGNRGQRRYLYLTNLRENALWFAQEKGSDVVLELVDVPIANLRVDPEDGVADSVEAELASPRGMPGYVVLWKPVKAATFRISRLAPPLGMAPGA